MKYKIVVDSASDLRNNYLDNENILFEVCPLSVIVDGKEFVDDDDVVVDDVLNAMHSFKGKSTSSCPPVGAFEEAFANNDADVIFCITLSKKLSGSYNAACLAKELISEDHEEKKVFVYDSRLVCGAQKIMVDKLVELIKQGLSYEEIDKQMQEFIPTRRIFFILHSFENFIKNGRINKIVATIINILQIKPICADDDGEIKIVTKIRGLKSTYAKLAELISESVPDAKDRTLVISKCHSDEEVAKVKPLLEPIFKEIVEVEMKGLCSFYALEKGMIFSY